MKIIDLEGWTASIEVRRASVLYEEFGAGPSTLLLQGDLANSNRHDVQAQALLYSYPVSLVDSRGHGRASGMAVASAISVADAGARLGIGRRVR